MRIILLATIGVTLVFLLGHGNIGMVRYFDADEFAYLHWAHDVVRGQRPYVDFFFYATPGFLWILAPLYWIASGTSVLLWARFVAFLIFVLLCITTGYLAYLLRKNWTALVAPLVLAFLPLPFDKFLEVRPDNLALLLAMIGIICVIKKTRSRAGVFWSGVFMAASALVIQKAIVFAAVTALFVVVSKRKMVIPYAVGFGLTILLFLFWALTTGDFGQVLYSIVLLPWEVSKISQFFIMMPDLFFYPNGIFYGADGYSFGLLTNHAVWIIGLVVGSVRLVIPFLYGGRERVWEEVYVAGLFFLSVVSYIYLYPFKHTQYLIPVAVCIALYVADGVYLVWMWAREVPGRRFLFGIIYTFCLIVLVKAFYETNVPKAAWTNTGDFVTLKRILATIPKGSPVLDLTGSTIFYPNAFYACCFPFGQSAPYFSRPLPSVAESLENSQTNCIFGGMLERVTTLYPQDQAYIAEHFHPWTYYNQLLVRNGL